MKSKYVFDIGVWLTDVIETGETTDPEEMRQSVLYMLESYSWLWECQGKTKAECSRKGYIIMDEWVKEVFDND